MPVVERRGGLIGSGLEGRISRRSHSSRLSRTVQHAQRKNAAGACQPPAARRQPPVRAAPATESPLGAFGGEMPASHVALRSSMPRCFGTPSSCHRGNHRFQHQDCRVGMLQSVSLIRLLIVLISRAASVRSSWLARTHPAHVPTCHRAPGMIGAPTAPSARTRRSQSQ